MSLHDLKLIILPQGPAKRIHWLLALEFLLFKGIPKSLDLKCQESDLHAFIENLK